MTIRDLLAAESINLNGTPAGKTEALNQCIDLMAKSGKIADVEKYRKGVFAREEEGTTGIGMGIAIPHCKSDALNHSMVHLQRLFSLSLHQTQRIMCIFRCLASSLLC